MADPGCVGEGAGWGTVDGARLRVLLLGGAEQRATSDAIARALSMRHQPTLVGEAGFFAAFHAARAAKAIAPQVVHAIGASGAAKSGAVVAAGIKAPFVVSVSAADVEGRHARATIEAIRAASAVLLEHGSLADVLRARGIERDLYVLSPPENAEEDATFLGALEVVYGRVIAGADVEIELLDESHARAELQAPAIPAGEKLVHIRRRKS